MVIEKIVQGGLKSNAYVVFDEKSKESVVIDPAADPAIIQSFIRDRDLTVKAILVTHGHFDHIGAVDKLRKVYQCPVITGRGEAEIMPDSTMNMSAYFNYCFVIADATDFVEDGDIITPAAGLTFRIIFVPGHSPDGVCYYSPENETLFSGDTLMEGRIGSTDYYAGNSYELIENIKTRLMVLPDTTIVHPGHGDETTIGHEREHNHYSGKSMWA